MLYKKMEDHKPEWFNRKGQKAALKGFNKCCNPYRSGTKKFRYWNDGWIKGREEKIKIDEEIKVFNSLRNSCPWYDSTGSCNAIEMDCEIENCAIWYFKKDEIVNY